MTKTSSQNTERLNLPMQREKALQSSRVGSPRVYEGRDRPGSAAANAVLMADENRRWYVSRSFFGELWRWLAVILIWTPILAAVLLGSVFTAIYVQARDEQFVPAQAIVVLGAAQFDGRPSAVLRSRLDTAYEVYRVGLAPLIIVTGGKEDGDRFTEAQASRDYLIDKGVPQTDIILENNGRDTWAQIQGVDGILEERDLDRVLIVSDGFHLFRAKAMADRVGIQAYAIASDESPIEPNTMKEFGFMVRETGAFAVWWWDNR